MLCKAIKFIKARIYLLWLITASTKTMNMNFWVILFFSICYSVAANFYFGWNALPKSDTEILSDGIGFILLSLAYVGNRP